MVKQWRLKDSRYNQFFISQLLNRRCWTQHHFTLIWQLFRPKLLVPLNGLYLNFKDHGWCQVEIYIHSSHCCNFYQWQNRRNSLQFSANVRCFTEEWRHTSKSLQQRISQETCPRCWKQKYHNQGSRQFFLSLLYSACKPKLPFFAIKTEIFCERLGEISVFSRKSRYKMLSDIFIIFMSSLLPVLLPGYLNKD